MIDDQLTPGTGLLDGISREKRWLLFLYFPGSLLVYFLFAIIFDHYQPGTGKGFDIVFGIVSNLMAFAWCRIDSRERGYELHRLFAYAIVFLGVLALIYYVFRSRGLLGGLAAVGWLLVYVSCTYIVVLLISVFVFIVLIATGVVSSEIL